MVALHEQPRHQEVEIPVSEEALSTLGWRCVVARTEGIEHLLSPLLAELRRDDCVHSWRQRLPNYGHIDSASVVGLLEAEKVRRPTTTFAYVALGYDDSEHVVAAGVYASLSSGEAHGKSGSSPLGVRERMRHNWRP